MEWVETLGCFTGRPPDDAPHPSSPLPAWREKRPRTPPSPRLVRDTKHRHRMKRKKNFERLARAKQAEEQRKEALKKKKVKRRSEITIVYKKKSFVGPAGGRHGPRSDMESGAGCSDYCNESTTTAASDDCLETECDDSGDCGRVEPVVNRRENETALVKFDNGISSSDPVNSKRLLTKRKNKFVSGSDVNEKTNCKKVYTGPKANNQKQSHGAAAAASILGSGSCKIDISDVFMKRRLRSQGKDIFYINGELVKDHHVLISEKEKEMSTDAVEEAPVPSSNLVTPELKKRTIFSTDIKAKESASGSNLPTKSEKSKSNPTAEDKRAPARKRSISPKSVIKTPQLGSIEEEGPSEHHDVHQPNIKDTVFKKGSIEQKCSNVNGDKGGLVSTVKEDVSKGEVRSIAESNIVREQEKAVEPRKGCLKKNTGNFNGNDVEVINKDYSMNSNDDNSNSSRRTGNNKTGNNNDISIITSVNNNAVSCKKSSPSSLLTSGFRTASFPRVRGRRYNAFHLWGEYKTKKVQFLMGKGKVEVDKSNGAQYLVVDDIPGKNSTSKTLVVGGQGSEIPKIIQPVGEVERCDMGNVTCDQESRPTTADLDTKSKCEKGNTDLVNLGKNSEPPMRKPHQNQESEQNTRCPPHSISKHVFEKLEINSKNKQSASVLITSITKSPKLHRKDSSDYIKKNKSMMKYYHNRTIDELLTENTETRKQPSVTTCYGNIPSTSKLGGVCLKDRHISLTKNPRKCNAVTGGMKIALTKHTSGEMKQDGKNSKKNLDSDHRKKGTVIKYTKYSASKRSEDTKKHRDTNKPMNTNNARVNSGVTVNKSVKYQHKRADGVGHQYVTISFPPKDAPDEGDQTSTLGLNGSSSPHASDEDSDVEVTPTETIENCLPLTSNGVHKETDSSFEELENGSQNGTNLDDQDDQGSNKSATDEGIEIKEYLSDLSEITSTEIITTTSSTSSSAHDATTTSSSLSILRATIDGSVSPTSNVNQTVDSEDLQMSEATDEHTELASPDEDLSNYMDSTLISAEDGDNKGDLHMTGEESQLEHDRQESDDEMYSIDVKKLAGSFLSATEGTGSAPLHSQEIDDLPDNLPNISQLVESYRQGPTKSTSDLAQPSDIPSGLSLKSMKSAYEASAGSRVSESPAVGGGSGRGTPGKMDHSPALEEGLQLNFSQMRAAYCSVVNQSVPVTSTPVSSNGGSCPGVSIRDLNISCLLLYYGSRSS